MTDTTSIPETKTQTKPADILARIMNCVGEIERQGEELIDLADELNLLELPEGTFLDAYLGVIDDVTERLETMRTEVEDAIETAEEAAEEEEESEKEAATEG